jgi:hypothetical protein
MTPLTDHCTAVFGVFETVAVSEVAVPSRTDVLVALTLMVIGGLPREAGEFAVVMPPHPAAA